MGKLRWGLVTTAKADTTDILNFAAHHLDLGAHRLFFYLDAPNTAAQAALASHPKCRVTLCDDGYWKRRGKRPDKHQSRQSRNATHCYRKAKLDWMSHIDVDEFLWPDTPVAEQLAAIDPDTASARTRPVEALAPDPDDPPPAGLTWFKGCSALRQQRIRQTADIYGEHAEYLDGGFLSHVQGKIFVRTGHKDISLRIHNAFREGAPLSDTAELPSLHLCHVHAQSLTEWMAHLKYRLAHGSYRASIKPAPTALGPGTTRHEFLSDLSQRGGDAALADFYNAVNLATPKLRDNLQRAGLLHGYKLDLAAKRARHFPNFS